MERDIFLVLIGGAISLVSSIVTLLLQSHLQARRQRRQWEREDVLRREAELRGDPSEIYTLRRRLEFPILEEAEKLGYFLVEKGGAGAEEWQQRRVSRAVAWVPLTITVALSIAILAAIIYFGLLPLLRFLTTLPVWALVLAAVILINVVAVVLLRVWARYRRGQRIIARLIELHPGVEESLYTRRGPVKKRRG